MKFTTKETSGVSVIKLEGSILGGPDAAELHSTIHKLIDSKKKKVVIDLSEVSLMNSSGLGILIGGVTAIRNAGGELKLASPSPKILSLLTVTKIISIFEVHDTAKKAVESF